MAMENGNNVNFKKSVQPRSSLSQNQRIVAIFKLMRRFNISEKEAEEILNR